MNHSEIMTALIGMSEADRRNAIREYRKNVLSDGFISYMQNQIEQIDDYVAGKNRGLSSFLPEVAQNFMVEANKTYKTQIAAVWESMYTVQMQLTAASADQDKASNVNHGASDTSSSFTGTSAASSSSCARCGSTVAANGVCNGCLDQEAFIQQDHIDYDRQLHEQQLERQDYQRVQDDYSYYDTQTNFDNEY